MSKFKRYALIALVAFGLFASSVACDDSSGIHDTDAHNMSDTIERLNEFNDVLGGGNDNDNNQ